MLSWNQCVCLWTCRRSVLPVRREWGVAGWSMSCQRISHRRLFLLWEGAALSLWLCCCWTPGAATSATAAGAAAAAGPGDGAPGPLGWLLSDKGPFHQSLEFTEAAERYQQGFSTRYKIYRWDRCSLYRCIVLHVFLVSDLGLECLEIFMVLLISLMSTLSWRGSNQRSSCCGVWSETCWLSGITPAPNQNHGSTATLALCSWLKTEYHQIFIPFIKGFYIW